MTSKVVFKYNDWRKLTDDLFRNKRFETALFAFYKESISQDVHRLLVNGLLIPEKDDYLKRTSSRVSFKPEFTEKALKICERDGFNLLDIHTHPWSNDVNFSGIDDREAMNTKIPYLEKYLKDILIAFLVFGGDYKSIRARFWDKGERKLSEIQKVIVI